jgi:hypothetical protein
MGKRIYFYEDMPFTSDDWVEATNIEKEKGWITFTIGEGEDWENEITVPASKVLYIK